jgi:cellulose synthase/poly-beta-1,6-N-acetylglucosamine synthase-like glycosyltransferase
VNASALPAVDVVVSTLNEEAYVRRCLESVLSQDYPPDRLRVLLVDGGSSDGTVAVGQDLAASDPRVAVISDGRRRNLPESLNIARERGSGELVAKIDAHGYPGRDYLRLAADAFRSDGAELGCVGGRPVQDGETRFGRAVALARTSRFGVGASEYAGTSERAMVDTVQCGVYRREVLERVGWFDPAMNFGEDEELNWRVRRAGYGILLDARMRFHYVTRPSWRATYRQYRNYGEARVRVVAAHPGFVRPHHLAPAALVASVGGLAAASGRSPAARRGLFAVAGAYAAAACGAAVAAARRVDPGLAPAVAGCFVALHVGYGVGTLRGLARLATTSRGDRLIVPLSSPSA